MRLIIVLSLILTITLFSPMVFAQEIQYRGFGGVTAINPTGTLVWYDSLMRSIVLDDENLVLAYDMDSMNIDSEIYDFSGRSNHGNMSSNIGNFDNATFITDKDSWVREDVPDGNEGSSIALDVNSDDTGIKNRRTFVEFDISSIPATAIVINASLDMYAYNSVGSFPRNYDARRVSASWVEVTITWNNQPDATGTNYTTAVSSGSGFKSWDITDMVEGWHNGTFSNYGIRVRDDTEGDVTGVGQSYYSEDYGFAGFLPKLEVTWGFQVSSIPLIASTFGQARDFDGYDDYVNSSLDISPDNFTLVTAIEPDSVSVDSAGILSKRAPGNEWIFYFHTDRSIRFTGWEDDSTITVSLTSNTQLTLDQSYIIGLSWNGTGACIWIDGSQDNCGNRTGNAIQNTTALITLGENVANPDRYFNGPIDEVLIFTDVKTDLEMSYLTTIRQQVIIGGGSASVPQRYAGLILALPWLIVAGIMFTMFYIAFLAWRKSLKGEW